MKVAVCIFGHLRGWKKCKESFMKYVHCLNPDVFVHTYSRLNYKGNTTKHTDEEIREMFNGVNIRSLVIEDDSTEEWHAMILENSNKYKNLEGPGSAYNCYSHFRKVDECKKLRDRFAEENNIQYDYVMYMRPNILFNSYWEDALHDIEEDVTYIAGSDHPIPQDLVAYGAPKGADVFSYRLKALAIMGKKFTKMGACWCDGNLMLRYSIEQYGDGTKKWCNRMVVQEIF